MVFHVTMKKDEESDWIVVECPALPGCVSQGKDEREALDNIKEAIRPKTGKQPARYPGTTGWLLRSDGKAGEHIRQECRQSISEIRLRVSFLYIFFQRKEAFHGHYGTKQLRTASS